MALRKDHGFTLLELLAAVIITSLIVVVIGRTMTDAANGLTRVSNDTLAVQSAMRLSRLLKYDIAGAQDVYVFGASQPVSLIRVCSSGKAALAAGTTPTQWNVGLATTPFVRQLFTVKVKEPDSYSPNTSAAPNWQNSKISWVGYELRRAAWDGKSQRQPQFQLWRVVCDSDVSGNPATTPNANPEKMADLGLSYPQVPIGAGATGTPFTMTCAGLATETASCPIAGVGVTDGSTVSATSYSFTIPYTDKRISLKTLADSSRLLQTLKRRLDA